MEPLLTSSPKVRVRGVCVCVVFSELKGCFDITLYQWRRSNALHLWHAEVHRRWTELSRCRREVGAGGHP